MMWSTPSSRNRHVVSRSALGGGIGGDPDDEDVEADMVVGDDGGQSTRQAPGMARRMALCGTCCYDRDSELGKFVTLLYSCLF